MKLSIGTSLTFWKSLVGMFNNTTNPAYKSFLYVLLGMCAVFSRNDSYTLQSNSLPDIRAAWIFLNPQCGPCEMLDSSWREIVLNHILPNQELSGAKSELPGGTVGVCSFHRRCGQLPYNLPITHLWFTPRSLQVCLLAHFNKWSIYE